MSTNVVSLVPNLHEFYSLLRVWTFIKHNWLKTANKGIVLDSCSLVLQLSLPRVSLDIGHVVFACALLDGVDKTIQTHKHYIAGVASNAQKVLISLPFMIIMSVRIETV